MINKIICVLLLLLFIILVYLTVQEIRKNKYKNKIENFKLYETSDNMENFSSDKPNKWSDSKEDYQSKTVGLNSNQISEVKDIVNQQTEIKVKDIVNNQKLMFEGPTGPEGPSGPAGSEYIISGRLANKEVTMDDKNKKMVVMRSQGTDDNGKAYMEIGNPFVSTQYWYLHKDGRLKSRFDEKCLTSLKTENSDLVMSECLADEDTNSINQKWEWDNKTNRLISKNKEGNNQFEKCVGLSTEKIDENTNLLAGCANNACGNSKKKFLKIKNCGNSVKPDEIWGFI